MLKGLAITPPVLGRIAIGKIVEKDGKRLPMKEDQFTITSQLQNKDGWILHPFDNTLRTQQGGKIRSIPIRLLFNEPDLNFRAEYSLFDRKTGRPMCVGNGETCRRRTDEGIANLPCPAPEGCGLAQAGACKPYGRLNVLIGDDDPLGSFIFRTTGFNSIRTLTARLQYFHAISGNRLSCMPLELKLRGKTTRQSHGSAIFYVDITLRGDQSIEEAINDARRIEEQRHAAGFDQAALDQAARLGFANGAFEGQEDDGSTVVEEFFPEQQTETGEVQVTPQASLATKLDAKARQLQTSKFPHANAVHP
ncbi:hydrolase or metal-binding protein [Methylotuvimicrobium sp. KM1]|uniref:recombination directionality factor n=1 Tax=Methylotuvimicrobium sp. KM1 TaxID=3377707 RepID=UPI00384EE9D8